MTVKNSFSFPINFGLTRFAFIILFVVVLFVLESEALRGGRGGGGFRSSSSRFSSSRTSSVRYSSTRVRVRYGSRYRPWGGSYGGWRSYGSHGHIYGYVWYTRSRHYHDYPDREPTICRNEFDNIMDNGTHYEWFICPSQEVTSDFSYCCGEEDQQHCCRFWDDGWRVFGMIFGLLVFFLSIFLAVYCCCCRKGTGQQPFFQGWVLSRKSNRAPNVHYRAANNGNPSPQINGDQFGQQPSMAGPTGSFPQAGQPLYPAIPPQPDQNVMPYPPVANPSYQQYPPGGNPQFPPYPPTGGDPGPGYPSYQSGGQPMPYQGGQPMPYQGGQPMPYQEGQPMPYQGVQPMPYQGGQPMPYPANMDGTQPYSNQQPIMDNSPGYPPYLPGPEGGYMAPPSQNQLPYPAAGPNYPVSPPPPYGQH